MSRLTIERTKLQDIIQIYMGKSKRERLQNRYKFTNRTFQSQGVITLKGEKLTHSNNPMPNVSKDALEDFWRGMVGEVGSHSRIDPIIRQWSQSLGDIECLKGDLEIFVT